MWLTHHMTDWTPRAIYPCLHHNAMYRLSPLSPVHLTRYACLMFLPPPFSNYCLNVESERTPRTINLHMGIGLFSRRMPGRHMGPSSLAQLPFCRAHLTDHLVTLPRRLTVVTRHGNGSFTYTEWHLRHCSISFPPHTGTFCVILCAECV
jgi:hypothetical protein